VLVKCHAGCTVEAVCESVGLRVSDLMPTGVVSTPSRRTVATYDYRDERDNLLFQVVRYDPKDFKQRRPKAGGGWTSSVRGVKVVPYRLPDLVREPTGVVVVAEGEKDVDNLAQIGVLATCNAGGAGKWTAKHAEFLRGRHVVIVFDNDDAGRRHAEQVAQSLRSVAASVRLVELPGLPRQGDVSDWIQAGGTKVELDKLAEKAPEWTPSASASTDGTAPVPPPWPELDRLDERRLPDFPLEALPRPLQGWVAAESHATQTPADLAAMLSLCVVASCIARHVYIEPRLGYREPTNLFSAGLMDPGNRKSAVFSDATRPLREVESSLVESRRSAVAREQSARRQAERRMQRAERLAIEKDDEAMRQLAQDVAAQLADWPEAVLPRLIVDDATSEKLGMLLADQDGRIASMSPEGDVFDLMAGLYSRSGMPQFNVYLMGHAGDDLIVDRVSRKSVHVERPALTCAYAIQPQVIKGIAGNPAFRGRGLLGRFLYSAPLSWIGRREIAPAPVPADVAAAYADLVRRLAEFPPSGTLSLDAEAEQLFGRWEAEVEAMLADGGALEAIRDWGAKLAGATLRIAAALHCAQHPDDAVSIAVDADTIQSAIRVARYLIPHAEYVLTMMQFQDDTTVDEARYVVKWIVRHERRQFTKRDAQQHGKRRFPYADDIDPALSELKRRGYIRLKSNEAVGPGRPPSQEYDVNPAVFDAGHPQERSQNSQHSVTDLVSANSENTENASGPPQSESSSGEDSWGEI
jgi:hypothetical protein